METFENSEEIGRRIDQAANEGFAAQQQAIIDAAGEGSEYAEDAEDEPENATPHPDRQERELAYFNIKTMFDLGWRERNALDASPRFREIIAAAHIATTVTDDWKLTEQLLRAEGII